MSIDLSIYFGGKHYTMEHLLNRASEIIGKPFTLDEEWLREDAEELYRNYTLGACMWCIVNRDFEDLAPKLEYGFHLGITEDQIIRQEGLDSHVYLNYVAMIIAEYCAWKLEDKVLIVDTRGRSITYDYLKAE
ncbi:MAG: hypothetical protein FWH27_16840 [Planctomycetaceae bacterium]|nr:hypothetical protein [Planctomycetaceae bacterium]